MGSKFILAAAFLIGVSYCAYSYPGSDKLLSGNPIATDTSAAEEIIDEEVPWSGTLYIAGGVGYPYKFRAELGFNIGDMVSFALNTGSVDTYMRGVQTALGILFKINIPLTYKFSPFVIVGTGGQVPFSEAKYSFALLSGGLKITLTRFLQLNPELGILILKETFYGEGFGPDLYYNKTRFGFHISLEIDIWQLF